MLPTLACANGGSNINARRGLSKRSSTSEGAWTAAMRPFSPQLASHYKAFRIPVLFGKNRNRAIVVVDDVNGAGCLIQRRGNGKPSGSLLHDFHMAVVYMTSPTLIGVHSCQVGIARHRDVKRVFP